MYYDRIQVPVTLYPKGEAPQIATAWVYKMTDEVCNEEVQENLDNPHDNDNYVK